MELKYMIRQSILGLGLGLCASLLIACGANQPTAVPAANMVNPASAFCTQNGGTLNIRQDAAGNQTGFCGFPDGSECEEWAFQRGECRPTSQNQAGSDASVKRLTMQDNNSKITLKKGEIIEIVLASNPSTGFAWSTGPDAGKLAQRNFNPQIRIQNQALAALKPSISKRSKLVQAVLPWRTSVALRMLTPTNSF